MSKPSTQRLIKVGVFGVGSLGQHHARVYSAMDGTDLVGIYDIDETRAHKVAVEHGTKVFDKLDELASEIEAASVAVPTEKHFDVFRHLAKHRLHLLIEKPIASTTNQAEAMVGMAEKGGTVLQVGHVERFNPVIQFLETKVSRPRFIEAVRLGTYPLTTDPAVPRGTDVSVVLDLMIHDLDIILHLVRSDVADIHAVGVPVLSPTEDIANVRLKFQNGCVANVTASRISMERMRKIRVFQEDTYVSLDYVKQNGQVCRKTDRGIEAQPVPLEKGEPLADELTAFIDCVRNRSNPVVSGRHASEALKLAVAICRCIRENPS